MKVLLIGSGGREHALYWKIKQSPQCQSVTVLPGNGGIAAADRISNCDPLDFKALRELVSNHHFDLVVVGPEEPLVKGIADELEDICPVFGPSRLAARLEASKEYSKEFMEKYRIPTAAYQSFTDYHAALDYLKNLAPPYVIKTDGLAAGKGVSIAQTMDDAKTALADRMLHNHFGDAGKKVVIEEFMKGEEASVFALCDGKCALPFMASQDHKRAFDQDKGPNTGGMGAYLPVPFITPEIMQTVQNEVLDPVIRGMQADGHPYKGLLYAGLMIEGGRVRVVEYNIRFGDPETQALMRLVDDDLLGLMYKSATGNLDPEYKIKHHKGSAIAVVLASEGYPGAYKKNILLKNLDNKSGDIIPFHAGTIQNSDGLYSSGGRVLAVTGTAPDLEAVRTRVYADIDKYNAPGLFYRKDIGLKGL